MGYQKRLKNRLNVRSFVRYKNMITNMFTIEIDNEVITDITTIDVHLLKCHENVIQDKVNLLKQYLESLDNEIVISSIIVCNKTNTIIDGHHRFHALKQLGISDIPVTYVNYLFNEIKTHIDDRITKEKILTSSLSGNLLPPKSTKHLIFDKKYKLYKPIILISSLYLLSKNKN